MPSSFVFSSFKFKSARKCDGVGLEAESITASMLASHRYTSFAGTEFFRWLALVIAELSDQPRFEVTDITDIPIELCAALTDGRVPLLSPPNCPWGEKNMQSGINFGDFSWLKNQEKKATGNSAVIQFPCTGSQGYTTIDLECTDEKEFGGKAMAAVTKTVAENSICLLIGSDLAIWGQGIVRLFDPDVSVYRMTANSAIERVSDEVTAAEWGQQQGRKIVIAVDLKKIYPNNRRTVAIANAK